MPDTVQSLAKDDIDSWIVRATLEGVDEQAILTGVCERLNGLGCTLLRVNAANNLLDPTLDARGVRWNRGVGGTEQELARRDDEDANQTWMRSPFYALLQSGETRLRRRLDASYRRDEYPILDELQDGGATDYVAFAARLGGALRLGEVQGLISSWATDAPDGFSDAQLALLSEIQPALALALLLRTWHRTARTLITTYLGADAAERVLAGNIVRGQAEAIRAVVWYSDLVGFTRISETVGAEGVLALLNDYAEAQVDAIEGHGGHVLKFIGDGMLAIFPHDDMTEACRRALDAASHQRELIAALNARRAASGLPVTDTHVALHLGDVLYGNVGSPRRLDFTVLGPAVNEAARIEALCGSLEQRVIASWAFAEAAGAGRSRLVSLGRYAMKGVARPQELYTLDTP